MVDGFRAQVVAPCCIYFTLYFTSHIVTGKTNMWAQPQPLTGESPAEVPLPRAPLERVIAQIRFPQILAIRNPDRVADFQELIRDTYPELSKEQGRNVDLSRETPEISERSLIWRFSGSRESPSWLVSLGVDFVALETTNYESRNDFLTRLNHIVSSLAEAFNPASAQRVGLRYIDRMKGEATEKLRDLIHPEVLGILNSNHADPQTLGQAAVHLITNAQFLAEEGLIQGTWGKLPPNSTHDPNLLEPLDSESWFLDLDMFTPNSMPYDTELVISTVGSFAKRIYSVFREMTTDNFLAFYGAEL